MQLRAVDIVLYLQLFMTNSRPNENIEPISRDFAASCFSAFCCSLVSLGLEVVLARIALGSVGSSAIASTVTITIYLCGLALGACIAQRSPKLLTIRGAASALVVSPLLAIGLTKILASANLAGPIILLFLTAALLLPSTSSAALVSLLATGQKPNLSNHIYLAANLGAFTGCLLTGFLILPQLGLSGCLIALTLIMAPASILNWRSQWSAHESDDPAEEILSADATSLSPSIGLILFSSALLMTVLECNWLRLSSLLLGSSSQNLAGTLAAVIGGLAVGNFFALKLSKNNGKRDSKISAAAALTLSTLACLLSLKSLGALPTIFQLLRINLHLNQAGNESLALLPQLIATAVLVLPTSVCLGLIYPLYTSRLTGSQWRFAYMISSAGAIAGPAVFLLLLPFTSLELIMKICIVLLASFTLKEAWDLKTKNTGNAKSISYTCVAGSILALVVTAASPAVSKSTLTSGLAYLPASHAALDQIKRERKYIDVLFYKDGHNSTVSVEEIKSANVRILKSDGKVEATIPIDEKAAVSGSDLSTQTMLALLPTMIHGGRGLKCLLVGLGSGTTSSTAQKLDNINSIDVVELEPAVVEAAERFQSKQNMARKIIASDARAHLKNSAAYDLIISQPSEPWVAGSASLFSVEFFRLMRQKLKPDGLAAQWLQLYGLNKEEFLCALKTFTEVFPDTLIFHQKGAGEILLIGASNSKSLAAITNCDYKKRFYEPSFRKPMALAAINSWNTFADSHLVILNQANQFSNLLPTGSVAISLNTDDNMRLEYARGRYLANIEGANEKQIAENLSLLENKQKVSFCKNEKVDDPSDYLKLNAEAKRLLLTGNAQLAHEYLCQSRTLNPSVEETRELLALALIYLGKLKEGLQETQVARLLNHQSCMPFLIAACGYQMEGNGTEARLNLDKAKQICPENEILNQIAGLNNGSDSVLDHPSINNTGNLKSILIRLSQAL